MLGGQTIILQAALYGMVSTPQASVTCAGTITLTTDSLQAAERVEIG